MPILKQVFPKKIKKNILRNSQGSGFLPWKNLVTVKNNELVVDYPKLPKKLNIILAREYGHEKPLELKGPFLFLENTHRAMTEEIGGFYEDDIKIIEEFMYAIWGNLVRDIMLGNFELPDKVPPLTLLIKDPEESGPDPHFIK